MHVPLNKDAVRDAMPAFFDLLRVEEHLPYVLCWGISSSCTSIPTWTEPHGPVPYEVMMRPAACP